MVHFKACRMINLTVGKFKLIQNLNSNKISISKVVYNLKWNNICLLDRYQSTPYEKWFQFHALEQPTPSPFHNREQCYFFYVKNRLPCVKKNGFPSVKMRTCTWKNLQKCPWKINSLREIFSKFTYVKIWRSIREKNDKFPTWKLSTLPWKKTRRNLSYFTIKR